MSLGENCCFQLEDGTTVWLGDARKILPTLPKGRVGLVVTSPPYFVARNIYTNKPDDLENAETFEEYLAGVLDVLKLSADLLVDGGRLCINIDDSWVSPKEGIKENLCYGTHAYIICELIRHGLIYKGCIIWVKMRSAHASGGASHLLGSYPYPPNIPIVTMYEYILIFKRAGRRQIPQNVKEKSKLTCDEFKWIATGVWEIPPSPERFPCPKPFPAEIPYRLINLFSFVGDIILDPFMGSGTTLKVARSLGRVGWGVEINEHFVDYFIRNETSRLIF